MATYYLDTNAWVYLNEVRDGWPAERLAELRTALAQACRCGAVHCVAGSAVFDEISRLYDGNRALFGKIVQSIEKLAGPRVLHSTRDLGHLEVASRRPLTGTEMFRNRDDRRAIFSLARARAVVSQVATEVAAEVAEFAQEERERRDGLITAVGPNTTAGLRAWWSDRDSEIDKWTTDQLRRSARKLNLPRDEAEWPKPSVLPSVRSWIAYKLARIVLNAGEGRRIQQSDLLDADHFASATYCDVIVTDDRSFAETCDAIGRRIPSVIRFEDFVKLVEDGRGRPS